MEKLKMESVDLINKKIEAVAAIFPNAITEIRDNKGNVKKSINFDILKQELSGDIAEGEECYDFTWVGKKAAIVESNSPVRKTLRPLIAESKNWQETQNLYIEGDNLDALKLLQESYLHSIKMIYIDPPYNTGKDSFIYNDRFIMEVDDYEQQIAFRDELGNIQFKQNNYANPRYHSNWCSMLYPRLKLALNLLKEDGVIFISIDDNEVHNLRKMCDEIFGENNFLTQLNWKGRGGRQDSKHYAVIHEYILCYTKNISEFIAGEEIKLGDAYPKYDQFKKRYYKTQLARKWGSNSRRIDRPNLYYSITAPDNTEVFPMLNETEEGCWRWGKVRMENEIKSGNVEFVKSEKGWQVYEKLYAPREGEEVTKKFTTWIDDIGAGSGADSIKDLFERKVFDYPKPVELLMRFMKMVKMSENDTILDFFSGSASTAHAVMQLNAEDGCNRTFIMIQLPEPCSKESEAYKAGYSNICEIGKERIRRIGERINADIDPGFRVFKVDSTNMKDVYYTADEYSQSMLTELESNIKEDRTDLDLLYGVLLDWGLPLTLKHKIEKIEGATVHTVDEGSLMACFDENISENVMRKIANCQPLRVVFRDSSFASTPAKINVTEIFKLIAPKTAVKVI